MNCVKLCSYSMKNSNLSTTNTNLSNRIIKLETKSPTESCIALRCDANKFIWFDNYDPVTGIICRLQFDQLGGLQLVKIQNDVILASKTLTSGWTK